MGPWKRAYGSVLSLYKKTPPLPTIIWTQHHYFYSSHHVSLHHQGCHRDKKKCFSKKYFMRRLILLSYRVSIKLWIDLNLIFLIIIKEFFSFKYIIKNLFLFHIMYVFKIHNLYPRISKVYTSIDLWYLSFNLL